MRVALLSDIHGNRWALEAVLDHVAGQRVDAMWNLGDILSGPLEPAATADLLMPLGLVTIAGNGERQLLACADGAGGASDRFAFEHTDPRHRAWLAGLPGLASPRGDILLCHGTPRSDHAALLESVDGRELRPASAAEIAPRLDGVGAAIRLIACGHTHVARTVMLDGRCLVNPGSVGLPAYDDALPSGAVFYVENGSPHASYAVIEQVEHGWQVSVHRIPYDWDAAAACAARHRRPEWAHALRTGFALRA